MSPRKGFTEQCGVPSGIAVIYARYSSHNQREVSIEQQIKACRKYAEAHNLKVVEIYTDKAVSGKTDRRSGFQSMLRDAMTGKFQYVIAWKSNRMGRNMLEAMINDARLREIGIKCLYTEEDFEDNAAGRFALRNMMNVNQFYSENMAEDIIRGMEDNASKCMVNSSLPYGYIKGEDGKYAIDEPKAEIVREIFERVISGEPYVDIYNDLNARGLRTSKGNPWNKGSFNRILTNERYRGVYIWGDTRIEGGVPRIVSDVMFYQAQEVLKTKKNAPGAHRASGEYLLTGKLFCGHCGSPMVGISGTSKTGDKHYYYACQKQRLEKTCNKKAVRRDWIEKKVVEAVKENVLRPDVIRWIVDGYDNFVQSSRKDSLLTSYEKDLADVNKSIKNLMSAIEQGVITPSTKHRLMELEEEKADLEINITIEKAAQTDVSKEQIEFWLYSFVDGKVENKKFQSKMIDTFVHAVYLYDDELRIVCNYTGDDDRISIPYEDVDSLDESAVAGEFVYAPDCSTTSEWTPFRRKRTSHFAVSFSFLHSVIPPLCLRTRHWNCALHNSPGCLCSQAQTGTFFLVPNPLNGGKFPLYKSSIISSISSILSSNSSRYSSHRSYNSLDISSGSFSSHSSNNSSSRSFCSSSFSSFVCLFSSSKSALNIPSPMISSKSEVCPSPSKSNKFPNKSNNPNFVYSLLWIV